MFTSYLGDPILTHSPTYAPLILFFTALPVGVILAGLLHESNIVQEVQLQSGQPGEKRVRVKQRLGKALVQKLLDGQKHASYVLITCAEPCDEGRMEVEMTYEGDQDLVSYLLESAHDYLDLS